MLMPRNVGVANRDSVIDVRMQPIAPLLPAVASKARQVCKPGPESAAALELWEQARTALQATVVSREVSPLVVHLHRFTRTYDALEHRMLVDSSQYEDLAVDRSFVAARTPVAFAQEGYLSKRRTERGPTLPRTKTFSSTRPSSPNTASAAPTRCIREKSGSRSRRSPMRHTTPSSTSPARSGSIAITRRFVK
jgi:hypothetical protein